MTSPFLYPKSTHRRTRFPPRYSNYRQYKPDLQQEFAAQCVYCRALDKWKGYESFGVDHYRPQKRFPNLVTEYLNLYYACNRCNTLKGRFWPSPDQERERIFIPNPCEHVMWDHLRYKGGEVIRASTAGEFTIEQLDLNDPDAVVWRTSVIGALALVVAKIEESRKTVEEATSAVNTAIGNADKATAADKLILAEENLQKLEEILRGLLE